MAVVRYDSKRVSVNVGGIYITGLGDGGIKIEKKEDNFSTKVGMQGDVVQNVSNNPLGKMTLAVLETSPQIPYLDRLAANSTMVAIWVRNANGVTKIAGGTNCAITKPAGIELTGEVKEREYEIEIFDLKM